MTPPERMMTALRGGAAVTRVGHVNALRLKGEGVSDLVDALTTSWLFLRENQMLQTLLLDQTAQIFADAFVCLDEDSWILLAEGPSQRALIAQLERVREQRFPSAEVEMVDLLGDHVLWSVDGPFAWEICSTLLGPELLGVPYLSFLRLGEVFCFRAGKTGEYGYLLLVPRQSAEQTWARLWTLAETVDLVEADLAALDQCALENWHFFMRALDGVAPQVALTPGELQLGWRVDAAKAFEGADALRRRRESGYSQRLTCFVAPQPVGRFEPVLLDEETIGWVLQAGWSTLRRDWVGWALLDSRLAWPGIRRYHVAGTAGAVGIETRSPPVLDNRSLFVDPRKHHYSTRDEHGFPPLVRG
jgi:glycine cleavage system aminomethyltransferase T